MSKAHGRLDDARDRFDSALAHCVNGLTRCCSEPMLHCVHRIGAIRQGERVLKPLHEWLMVVFTLDSYVRGYLIVFTEYYVVFTEIAVITEGVSNGSKAFG